MIGSTLDIDDVKSGIRRCFTHEILADAPSEEEREILIKSFMGGAGATLQEKDWKNLTRHTAGLSPLDLKSLAAEACTSAALSISNKSFLSGKENGRVDGKSTKIPLPVMDVRHVDEAIASVREKTASDIGAPKIPSVKWEDVGGLENVKLGILDTGMFLSPYI